MTEGANKVNVFMHSIKGETKANQTTKHGIVSSEKGGLLEQKDVLPIFFSKIDP